MYPPIDGMGAPLPYPPAPDEKGPIIQSVPPHYEDMFSASLARLKDAGRMVDGALAEQIGQTETALQTSAIAVSTAVQTAIGQVDNALRIVQTPINAAIDKQTDIAFTNLVNQNLALEASGIPMPRTVADAAADLADQTGERTLQRLAGINPDGLDMMPVSAPEFGATTEPLVPHDNPEGELPFTGYVTEQVPVQPQPSWIPEPTTIDLGASGAPVPPFTAPSPPASPVVPPVVFPVPNPPVAPVPEPPEDDSECGCSVTCPAPSVTVNVPPCPVTPASPYPPAPTVPPVPPPTPVTRPEPEFRAFAAEPPGLAAALGPPDRPIDRRGAEIDARGCAHIKEGIRRYTMGPFYAPGLSFADTTSGLAEWYRIGRGFITNAITLVSGGDVAVATAAGLHAYGTTGDILGGHSQVFAAMELAPRNMIGDKDAMMNLALTISVMRSAEENSHAPMSRLAIPLEYAFNYLTSATILSQTEYDALYTARIINYDDWICYTKMNGNDAQERTKVLDLLDWYPNPNETTSLAMRGAIRQVDYDAMMTRAGVHEDKRREWIQALMTDIPTASDLVHFMTRDAADDAVAKQYDYDKDFELKLYGPRGKGGGSPVEKWMIANGITEDRMRMDWRSHWKIPSDTQLISFFQRLRPDRDEVIEWEKKFGVGGPLEGAPGAPERPIVVTRKDIQDAIEVNDMAPGWVAAFIECSYHPITRTDAIDAYHSYTIDEHKLYEYMLDNGSSPENAQLLVDIQKNKRALKIANGSGVWTIRKILKEYADGTINGVRADILLRPLVIDNVARAKLINDTDDWVEAQTVRKAIARMKRGYYTGALTADDVTLELKRRNLMPFRIRQLLDQWEQEVKGRYKEPAAQKIIQWMTLDVISEADAFQRFQRLGYSIEDARRMTYQGRYGRAKEVERIVDKREKNLQRIIRDQKQAAREAKADLEKRMKELKQQQEKDKKEMERIQKELDARQTVLKPADALADAAAKSGDQPPEVVSGDETPV